MKYSRALENVVVALNTEQNCIKRENTAGTKNVEYTWTNLGIDLFEYSVMKLVSIAHDCTTHATDHGDNIIQFRLKNVYYNPSLYKTSEKSSYPLIFASSYDSENQYNFSDLGGIYLVPQYINTISFVVSDSMTDCEAGLSKNMQFIIMLVIQPYDKKYSALEN
jgi:hypothetical protein